MSEDVPDEILREILQRLPVAPLLRFRCVSKSWKGLIDSHKFVKDHLNHARKTNSNLNLVIRSRSLHSADFDLLNQTNQAIFHELSHPLKTPYRGTETLGSCDGLIVLSNGEEDNILWNPSVRRFHKIPITGIELSEYFTGHQYIVYGFGYDFVSDDYKLVKIQFYRKDNDDFNSEVKVYSLKSDSWRRIRDFPYYLKYKRGHGELANGALHWVVSTKADVRSDSLVVAFDLGTEEYRLVPLPEFAGHKVHMNVVATLGGCLSLMCNYYKDRVDIWVMKEYGVQDSWLILFTLRHSDVCFMRFDFMSPIAYSNCGRKVLVALDSRVLMWYDLDKKSIDRAMVRMPLEKSFEFHPCLQSLLLLDSGTCDFNLYTKKNQKGKSTKSSGKRDDFLSKGFNLVL